MNKKLRTLRQQKGLSQQNMATELNITQKAYSKIENGETALSHNRMLKISEILDVLPKELCSIYTECHNNSKLQRLLGYLKEKGIKTPNFDK